MSSAIFDSMESVRMEQAAYLAALTEQEKTDFVLNILHDTAHPQRGEESADSESPTDLIVTDSSDSLKAHAAFSGSSPIRMSGALAFKNNFRARCGCDLIGSCSSESHGTSYVDVDYNYGIGRGRYDIVVRIRHYGLHYYGTGPSAWNKFVNAPAAYRLWMSARLFGPGSPGRGGYFGSGNNQTPGRHTGTLGVEVFEPGTNNQIWWGLWDFSAGWGSWGDQWLRCGHDYNFWFADT